MSDPAIEAASRAWRTASHGRHGDLPSSEKVTAMITDAAREALAPIRAVLDKLAADTEPPCDFAKRIQLEEQAISALSPLIYSTDELA